MSGGLLFGIGFALLGYCPGTGAAALAGILGLMAGSHLYVELSWSLDATVLTWGNRGRIMLPDLTGMALRIFLPWFVALLLDALFLLEWWTG